MQIIQSGQQVGLALLDRDKGVALPIVGGQYPLRIAHVDLPGGRLLNRLIVPGYGFTGFLANFGVGRIDAQRFTQPGRHCFRVRGMRFRQGQLDFFLFHATNRNFQDVTMIH